MIQQEDGGEDVNQIVVPPPPTFQNEELMEMRFYIPPAEGNEESKSVEAIDKEIQDRAKFGCFEASPDSTC